MFRSFTPLLLLSLALLTGCEQERVLHNARPSKIAAQPGLSALQLTPQRLTVPNGVDFSIPVLVSQRDGTQKRIRSKYFTWQSTTTNANGLPLLEGLSGKQPGRLLARAPGVASVRACLPTCSPLPAMLARAFGHLESQAKVTIVDSQLQSIQLSADELMLAGGKNNTVHAMGIYLNKQDHNQLTWDLSRSLTRWEVSDSQIAHIRDGKVITLKPGSTTVTAVHPGADLNNPADDIRSNTITITLTAAELTGVQIQTKEGNDLQLPQGVNQRFLAIATLNDGSSFDVSRQVKWHSSIPHLAAVDRRGLLTAHSPGRISLSARLDDMTSPTLEVTVTRAKLKELIIAPNTIHNLPLDTRQTLDAQARFSDGSARDVSSYVNWHSSKEDVATVSLLGVLHTSGKGETQIKADYLGQTSQLMAVSVSVSPLVELKITPTYIDDLPYGAKEKLTAIAVYADGTSRNVSREANWVSSDPERMLIGKTGLAQAVQPGRAQVAASFGGHTATAVPITVSDVQLVALQLEPQINLLPQGQVRSLSAIATYSDQRTRDVSREVTWQSQNPSLAQVSEQGKLNGVLAGETTIAASLGELNSAPVRVLVTDPADRKALTLAEFSATPCLPPTCSSPASIDSKTAASTDVLAIDNAVSGAVPAISTDAGSASTNLPAAATSTSVIESGHEREQIIPISSIHVSQVLEIQG
ncbi:MAG: Ig-like domain-containing protein [Aeromonas sp.]